MAIFTRYIICYKDSATSPMRYFGPFVSDVAADDFRDRLPNPLEGGQKLLKKLQDFQSHEGDKAAELILSKRVTGKRLVEHYMGELAPA